jgi:glycosyltransferase involved in cell wall biosynthesis
LAKEMDRLLNHNFFFIETAALTEERKKMGWGGEEKPEYVLSAYQDENLLKQAKELIFNADVVIWGSCPFSWLRPRLKAKKLTIAYSERILKGCSGFKNFLRKLKYYFRLRAYQKNHYLLCASAYAAKDYNDIGLFVDRAYKWGYFPVVKQYEDIETLIKNKKENSIVWVARLIEWKHPEMALKVAKRLKEAGYQFQLNIIGSGVLEQSLKEFITTENLQDCISMLGSISPEQVRLYMEQSEIFLFTSDSNEGWGAVLNESMNSACAIVANKEIGSVPFVVQDGKNGLIYENGNIDQLYDQVVYLLNHQDERKAMQKEAYETLCQTWNAEIAAQRLLMKINEWQGKGVTYDWAYGPMSKEGK